MIAKKDITLVAVANRRPEASYYTYDEFFATARRHGFEPTIIGNRPGEYQGLGSKPKLLRKALSQGLLNTKYILFADAFDVVFQSPIELAVNALHYYDADIVWNAERNCFPDTELAPRHNDPGTSFRYLNSGFGIGYRDAFIASLEEMDLDSKPADGNDQDWWMRQHLFGKACRSALDHDTILCLAMHQVGFGHVALDNGLIQCFETGHTPIGIHFNGPSKTAGLREPVLRTLGFTV